MTSCTRALVSLALVATALPATWTETRPAEAAGRRCFGREATIVGTQGPDEITVGNTHERVVIVSLGGNDRIKVGGGNWDHYVCTGGGNDRVITGRHVNHVRGGAGGDTLVSRTEYGDMPSNRFFGGRGNDRLIGANAEDYMIPGPGNDYITDRSDRRGEPDTLILSGSRQPVRVSTQRHVARGQGRDTFFRMERIVGSPHDDVLVGDEDPEWFFGLDGNDELKGNGGNDRLFPGEGADTIAAGGGDDLIDADRPAARESTDTLDGGRGFDWVSYAHDLDSSDTGLRVDLYKGTASGEHGTDRLERLEGAIGSRESDILIGDERPNNLIGDFGDDELHGNGGEDVLGEPNRRARRAGWNDWFGDEPGGDDLIDGGAGNDRLYGGVGDDTLTGGEGNDSIVGTDREFRAGRDEEYTDTIDGGPGTDEISYEHAEVAIVVDLLAGFAQDQEGTDTLVAIENIRGSLHHDDRLSGDHGDNSIYGGRGDDTLDGGAGFDRLFGGPDEDICVNGEELSGCES